MRWLLPLKKESLSSVIIISFTFRGYVLPCLNLSNSQVFVTNVDNLNASGKRGKFLRKETVMLHPWEYYRIIWFYQLS